MTADDADSGGRPGFGPEQGEEPFAWWGPPWQRPHPMTLADLVAARSLSVELAAALQLLMIQRTSVVVLAGPSGAGKTTFLTALLAELPSGTRRVYLRGCYETFQFLADPTLQPGQTVVLANEVSPHLPVYLWGDAVAEFLALREQGFAIAATAHATSVDAFVASLTGYPLHIPDQSLAAFEVAVILDAFRTPSGQIVRRVASVWALAAAPGGGLHVERLMGRDEGAQVVQSDVLERVLARRGAYWARHTLVTELQHRADMLRAEAATSPYGEQPEGTEDG